MQPMIRLAHPMAFSAFLHQAGAPAERYVRRHRLPVLCDDPNAFVPLLRAWAFFDDAARHEDLALGWLVGTYVGDHSLSAGLLRKLETAPTLLRALQELVRLARSELLDLEMGIRERRDDILVYMHLPRLRQAPGYMIGQAYRFSVVLDVIRYFIGRNWSPHEIGIESPVVYPTLKERLPGTRIQTQQQTDYIAVPRCYLHRAPFRTIVVAAGEDDPPPSTSLGYVDTLRAVIRSYLSEGYLTQQSAAELMGTAVRTMTRKLSDHSLTYGTLLDELRFQVAKDHLQNPDMRIVDVAQSVGFNDQGDFTRMFRRVGGLTPGQYRNAVRV